MLKLILGDGNTEVQSADIPVRWCVDKETLAIIKKQGILDPHVLIVVVNGNIEMSRHLVPLDYLVEYVSFYRPGKNTIYAIIVWDSEGKRGLWDIYLKKRRGIYQTDLIYSYDGRFSQPQNSMDFTEMDIVVPNELFAKGYPKREKRWVNLWFETRPRDQCHYRKRRFLAYTIQPLVMGIYTLLIKILLRWVGVIAFISLGLCFYFEKWNPKTWKPLMNLKPLIHPWKYNANQIINTDGFKAIEDGLGPVFLYTPYIYGYLVQ